MKERCLVNQSIGTEMVFNFTVKTHRCILINGEIYSQNTTNNKVLKFVNGLCIHKLD